jgi:hypothetical protein
MKSEIKVESLAGTIGERVRAVWEGNLQQLDWEQDFLAPFRTKSAEGGYIGLGKTLSGLVHAARHFGGAADALRRRIVGELLKTQAADCYIGLYRPASQTYKVWDVHEQAYIMQALVENAEWFGDSESLQAAERLGRWLLPRLEGGRWRAIGAAAAELGDASSWNPLVIVGLDRALAALTRATGDTVFADFCRDEIAVPDWCDPIVEGRQGGICGHAYAYLARCLAQLETSDGMILPDATRAVIGYLRAGGGLVISGTCGQSECWHSDQRLDGELGETCTTAYLVRWAAHLLRRTHDAWFGDLMERAIYNALFAASSVDGRRIRYYSAGAGARRWHEVDTYCCPGNYRRIVGELPDFIARPHDGGLALDLYEACRLTCPVGDQTVQLHVTTDYPFDHVVTIAVVTEQPVAFPLHLRCPGWADSASVRVNGEALSAPPREGWIRLARTWQAGDRVELAFGMPWRLIRGFRRQFGRVALMRGPVVWGADPADNAELADRLTAVVPDRSTCCLSDSARRTTVTGALDSRQVDVALVPFATLDTAVTYFSGRLGMGDERDHLLWLAPDPVGVGPGGSK